MRNIPSFAVIACLLLLASCGGGGAEAQLHSTSVSKGQELIDLKKAYDAGVISESEFERQKSEVLDR